MVGVVSRDKHAEGRLGPLEVSAAAFEGGAGSGRVILCGVDTLAIQGHDSDRIRQRVADLTGADPAGILLNWNHTHHAPPGGQSVYGSFGESDLQLDSSATAYIDYLHARIVEVCCLACERLEPAWIRWGLGQADVAINRRERGPDGMAVFGWNPDGLVDHSVPVLQSLRQDGSAIATVVSYGCHTVTLSPMYAGYSADYPGPLRDLVRSVTGGEAVFLQGAGGNLMPTIGFDGSGESTPAAGRQIALAALGSLEGTPGWPARLREIQWQSGTRATIFRWERVDAEPPHLEAVAQDVDFPLLPLPTVAEITAFRETAEQDVAEAERNGASEPELRRLRYHGLNWARRTEEEIGSGEARTSVRGSVHAIRIGGGAIVTGPGEIFTEIGLAVKERSPADVTLYAGYTNGCISYFPTAAEYPLGGYEPSYGNKTYGLPAQVAPDCERLLIETAVTLVCSLFPERVPPDLEGWNATGALPEAPASRAPARPIPGPGEKIPVVEMP